MAKVAVTGGSGFVGSHCIMQLLAAGHQVRATVRSLAREGELRGLLGADGGETAARLSFVAADLGADEGWSQAFSDCEYVLHVASPFPATIPKDENDLIRPAREGTLRVLAAARDNGVRRVVMTSSFAAIGYGHPQQPQPFDESQWTRVESPLVQPYAKSKTLAERAAWDFVAREGRGLELAVVNPVAIFGPLLGPDLSTSILIVQRLLDGAVPGCPHLWFGVVDVRDVADLHLRAMVHPSAAGERFLAVAGDFLSISQIAEILRSNLGPAARRVPTRHLPDWLVRLAALVDPSARQLLPELGKRKNGSNARARQVLAWQPRPAAESVLATAESLKQLGLLKHPA